MKKIRIILLNKLTLPYSWILCFVLHTSTNFGIIYLITSLSLTSTKSKIFSGIRYYDSKAYKQFENFFEKNKEQC